MLDAAMPTFVELLLKRQEWTWQKLLMAFVWKVEMLQDLVKTLETNQELLSEQERNALRDYIELHDWKFD
jgi:hypothetical protein